VRPLRHRRHPIDRHHHFKVLRHAGIVRQHYVGASKLNSLRRADLDTVAPGLIDAILAAPENARR
jgi:hypothetical protein